MTIIDAVFDAYLNINILLIVVFALWCLARLLMKPLGMGDAYTTQLRVLNGIFITLAVSPVVVLTFGYLSQSHLISPQFTVNLSDIVVAQYLQGNFQMKPAVLEELLGLRTQLTNELLGLTTNLGMLIATLIIAGAILFSIKLAYGIYVLRAIIRQSHEWRRHGNLWLLVSDTVLVPFSTRTLMHRYIVIPSTMLTNPGELKMAIVHEFQHLRQHDLEWELGLELLRPIFFWNPAYYLWKRQVENLRELSCDQQLLARRNFDPVDYCQCLLNVCQNSLAKSGLPQIAIPKVALIQTEYALFGRNSTQLLNDRVKSLLSGKLEAFPKTKYLGLMIPLVAIVIVSTLAIQRPDDWSQDRIMLSTIVNLERLAVRNNPTSGI